MMTHDQSLMGSGSFPDRAGSGWNTRAVRCLTVGVPAELKDNETRVAITPDGVRELTQHDVPVLIEAGAGGPSSIPDEAYERAGARIVPDAATVWAESDLVCKVKEPLPDETAQLRSGQVLFTFLHLAAHPEVADALLDRGVVGVAYETVQLPNGELPLLAPMSEVAGRMATQIGAHFLEREAGGRGILLGGVPGVRPARVVVVGAGNVGWNAAWIAAGMEAEVFLLDRNLNRLRWVDQIHRGRIQTLTSNRGSVERSIAGADLVIGAVLVPGGRAPIVVTEQMIRSLPARAVIVDVAIDQGGCVEGIRETTHANPIFERHGVLHYAVPNIPSAVPHTSTYALTNVTLPYVRELATRGLRGACQADPALAHGVNTVAGAVTHEAVATALQRSSTPLNEVLDAI
jgi:alanine dehydrogenase